MRLYGSLSVVVVAAVYLSNMTPNYTDSFNLKTSKLIQLKASE